MADRLVIAAHPQFEHSRTTRQLVQTAATSDPARAPADAWPLAPT